MKKKIAALLLLCICLSGCGKNISQDSWGDATDFGDINMDAETVNIYTTEEEYEIDKYLTIEELNLTKPDAINDESFRIYYNRIGSQVDLPYILPSNGEKDSSEADYVVTKYIEDGTGVYIKTYNTGRLGYVYCEFPFNSKTDENFQKSVGRIFAVGYAGLPNMTKYQLNEMYFEIMEAMAEDKGSYDLTHNDMNLHVQRDYGYVYVTVSYTT